MDAKISYAITVCTEILELEKLLTQLRPVVTESDEIVIQVDESNHDPNIFKLVETVTTGENPFPCNIQTILYPLDGDFARFKNHLKANCTGDYIFQIDADELLGDVLLYDLKELIELNEEVDVFYIPRINIVLDHTNEDVSKYGWRLHDLNFPISKYYNEQLINFPDYQGRLFKNTESIQWTGKVHEHLTGFEVYTALLEGRDVTNQTTDSEYAQIQGCCLIHVKDIERQRSQNSYYDTITTN